MSSLPVQAVIEGRQFTAPAERQDMYSVRVVAVDDPLRKEAEQFIAAGFERSYSACLSHYMPLLVSLKSDAIRACLGVRPATETLFVEHYLDTPVEVATPGLCRQQIAEIGNLVSTHRHSTILLFMITAIALHRAGFKELVFCATRQVAGILKQTGARLQAIVEADGRRLGSSLPEWGRYYDTRPVVMRLNLDSVIDLIQASPLLKRHSEAYRSDIEALVSALRERS